MGLNLKYICGQTPISEEEKEGILIKIISTRGELDEFEQKNIEKAVEWSLKKNFHPDSILSESFIMEVHKQMFDEVWDWAGKQRNTNKNIGVDKHNIIIELRKLIDDCKYWIDKKVYPVDELVIRFKHRLVAIHIFPNGNGRHSRLCADILISHGFNKPVFSWGTKNLSENSDVRKKYLEAIREADKGSYKLLIVFGRS